MNWQRGVLPGMTGKVEIRAGQRLVLGFVLRDLAAGCGKAAALPRTDNAFPKTTRVHGATANLAKD